jgi:hypothetical protein
VQAWTTLGWNPDAHDAAYPETGDIGIIGGERTRP